jgi:hypothetical protein
MKDLASPRWMYVKAILFLLIGLLAAGLILLEHWSWRLAALLALSIWAFCRVYYFAFYVIGHYVDPTHKFSGLGAFLVYLIRRGRRGEGEG